MRLLCIDAQASLLDLSMRCQAAGHDVRWYVPPSPKTHNIGRGIIKRIDDLWDWYKWADLIVYADNTKWLHAVEILKERGWPVVSATPKSAEWELDRSIGQKVWQKAGIPVIPAREFKDYDSAIAYVEKTMGRYVSKPSGSDDKSLSYVSKSAQDMVFMLQRWKKNGKNMGPFILQEFRGGIEMAVGAYIGPNGFMEGWCENFEHKKLMDGDRGVACFDESTEVLTGDGWKYWPEITERDTFCTMKDGHIVYDSPSQIVVADFDGELVGWKSETIDILVTPNHNMYVQDDHARKAFWFESAAHTAAKKRLVLRTGGIWAGRNCATSLPSFYRGSEKAWAALVGAYIADGNCRERSIVFGNCPRHKQIAFSQIAKDAGYEAKLYGRDLYINSANLARHFRDFGTAHEKRIPQYIKDSGVSVISAFLRGYGIGDGTGGETNLIYTTVSRILADDLQETLLKVGLIGTVNKRDRRNESHIVNGYLCVNRHIAYDISVAQRNKKANIGPNNIYNKPHKGKIYCVTVPSHIIYVRRNGKPCWIGQTGEQGTVCRFVRNSKLADKVLKPLEKQIVATGHVSYVDVNCIVDDDGNPWPLEWTMRKGYPTIDIQLPLLKGDPAEWLLNLAMGETAPAFRYDEVSTGVVLSIPDYPYSHLTKKEVTGIPVYGLDKVRNQIHPAEMMMGEAPLERDGRIRMTPMLVTAGDYVLIATGTGSTVQESTAKSYRAINSLEVPNSPMWRGDIGRRLKRELPKLQAMGYADRLSYM